MLFTVSVSFDIEELRNQVAAGLWQTGYCVDWAYEGTGAEGQAGERSTSRDLLLALGWLIAAGTLEKLLTERVRRVDTTLLTPTRVCAITFPEITFGGTFVLGDVSVYALVSVLGEPRPFRRGPIRAGIPEEASVARRPLEIPGLDFAVHAGRKSSPAPRSENTFLLPRPA